MRYRVPRKLKKRIKRFNGPDYFKGRAARIDYTRKLLKEAVKNVEDFSALRNYAQGEQDIEAYKKAFGI